MTKLLLNLLLVISGLFVSAQSPQWLWAQAAGSLDGTYANDVAIDGAGNRYVCGTYYEGGAAQFGTIYLPDAGTAGAGVAARAFLAKYDKAGNILWAKSFGPYSRASGAVGNKITLGADGYMYFAGTYRDSIAFDNFKFYGPVLLSSPTQMFVAKMDTAGNFIWVKSAGGVNSLPTCHGAVADLNGNVFICGVFENGLKIDGDTITGMAGTDGFVGMLNNNGGLVWLKPVNGSDFEFVNDICIDKAGKAVITGAFTSKFVHFGNDSLLNSKQNKEDAFVARIDENGIFLWEKNFAQGRQDQEGVSVISDVSGFLYVLGDGNVFTDTMFIGGAEIFTSGTFIVKFDYSGVLQQFFFAPGFRGNDIVTATDNQVYVAGNIISDSTGFENFAVVGLINEAFVGKLDATLNAKWIKPIIGNRNVLGMTLALDGTQSLTVAGQGTSDSLQFDNLWLQHSVSTATGYTDLFIATLGSITDGITSLANDFDFSIYPNPTGSTLYINMPEEQKATISIYNMEGEILMQQNYSHQFYVGNLPAGMYVVQVSNTNGVGRKMFVKI